MREACKAVGVTLLVGHCFRRSGAARKIKQMIEQNLLGNIVLVEANFSTSGKGLTPEAWRYYKDQCPGGHLMQLGIHHVDTLHYLLGPIVEGNLPGASEGMLFNFISRACPPDSSRGDSKEKANCGLTQPYAGLAGPFPPPKAAGFPGFFPWIVL